MTDSMDIITILILASAILVGWSVGKNSASNVISMLVGPRITRLKSAILIVSALMFLGALLQSGHVIKTVGDGIIPKEELEKDRLITLSALITTVLFMSLVTSEAIPVSSSQAIIGSLIGASVAMGAVNKIDAGNVLKITVSWLATPILSLIISYALYTLIMIRLAKKTSLISFGEIFKLLAIVSAAFVAYGLGANDTGNAVGLVIGSSTYTDSGIILAAVSAAMILGAVSYSKKVARTVSKDITLIDPVTAFTAQFSAGIVILFYTHMGIPISATQALIGGLVGVGMTKGTGMVNKNTIKGIFIGWVITPISTAIISLGLYEVLILLLPLAPYLTQ